MDGKNVMKVRQHSLSLCWSSIANPELANSRSRVRVRDLAGEMRRRNVHDAWRGGKIKKLLTGRLAPASWNFLLIIFGPDLQHVL